MEASRIANVSAAVLIGGAKGPRCADAGGIDGLLERLFDETLRIDESGDARPAAGRGIDPERPVDVVDGLATALLAARSERVIVAGEGDPRVSAESVLALVAWPEKPVVLVMPDASGRPADPSHPFGIFRRDALEGRARARLERSAHAQSLATFLAGLEVERVSLAQLGLAPRPIPPFTGPPFGPGGAG
jgi:hypothetical protein